MLKDVLFWIYVVEGRDGMSCRMTSFVASRTRLSRRYPWNTGEGSCRNSAVGVFCRNSQDSLPMKRGCYRDRLKIDFARVRVAGGYVLFYRHVPRTESRKHAKDG